MNDNYSIILSHIRIIALALQSYFESHCQCRKCIVEKTFVNVPATIAYYQLYVKIVHVFLC